MGRKKINIRPIEHSSTRRATFEKRRIGLLKKAMELSILCKSTLSLTIYTEEGEVYVYSSEPYENVVNKFQNYRGPYRLLTNDHLPDLVPGKSESNSVGFEIIKQPNSNTRAITPTINRAHTFNPQIVNTHAPIMVMPRIQVAGAPQPSYSNTSSVPPIEQSSLNNSNSSSGSIEMNPRKKRRTSSISSVSSNISYETMRAINQLDVSDVYNNNDKNSSNSQTIDEEPILSGNNKKRSWDEMMKEESLVPDFNLPAIFNEGSVEFDSNLSSNMQRNAFLQ